MMPMMPRVFLVTPYAEVIADKYKTDGYNWLHRPNVIFAQRCMADCLRREEAVFACHLLYTQPGVLDDAKTDERHLGLTAGRRFLAVCDRAVCYVDRGISSGMRGDLEEALRLKTPINFRRLDGAMVGGTFLHTYSVPHWPCGLCLDVALSKVSAR
jgi:hypothetical protein